MTALTSEQIKEIAGTIDCGFVCHWNIKSNRLIFIPSNDEFEYDDSGTWDEDIKELELNSSEYKQIEKPDSTESFRFMEDFTDELPDNTRIKVTLIEALNKRKPFREFKYAIDNSGEYRQLWFDFKNQKMIEYVKDSIDYIVSYKSD
ncbi:UPF0158 family protein [Pedobacter borealis]|uniref:UPF0158 family protein n=1 Tax=Pedobacter borealis TaxID=475254 RepID=UPI0004930A76|nr:UPF0158 family protein [Pedobacter borealis]